MPYAVLVALALVAIYVVLAYIVYHRSFVPIRPFYLDDFSFTPYEFQADYEDVELVTADGVAFGAWYFRQPGSPQTIIVSGGHKGQRQGALGISVAPCRKGFHVILYSYPGMPGIAVLRPLEPPPLFFIHGGADQLTSVNHSRRLYDAYRGPREIWIVQGAPHTGAYFADRPLYVERVAGFFARNLGLNVSSHLRLVEEEEVS